MSRYKLFTDTPCFSSKYVIFSLKKTMQCLDTKSYLIFYGIFSAPPAPQPPGIMNNGSRDTTKDVQKLQQQLQDIKDQVSNQRL